jgi:hypothetical protein
MRGLGVDFQDTRHSDFLPGSLRVLARTGTDFGGTAVPLDGFARVDGIATSIGRRVQAQEARRAREVNLLKSHPISVPWVAVVVLIGAAIQWGGYLW